MYYPWGCKRQSVLCSTVALIISERGLAQVIESFSTTLGPGIDEQIFLTNNLIKPTSVSSPRAVRPGNMGRRDAERP